LKAGLNDRLFVVTLVGRTHSVVLVALNRWVTELPAGRLVDWMGEQVLGRDDALLREAVGNSRGRGRMNWGRGENVQKVFRLL